MEKKRKLKTILWVGIGIVVILLIVGVLVFGSKFFEKKTDTIKPVQPCTTDTTLLCDNGNTIITKKCNNGTLTNTGKVCPCTKNSTITCSNGNTIVLKECVNGTLISTGKICPCTSDVVATCYDGNTTITHNCINGTLISTGKTCPQPPAPLQVVLNAQRLQAIFQKSEYFTKLPSNAAVLLSFYDANHNTRSEKFFISGGGVVKNYGGENYDLEFIFADFRIERLEAASDLCAELKKIKEEQNMAAKIKNVLSVGKYMYLKDCVPFSI